MNNSLDNKYHVRYLVNEETSDLTPINKNEHNRLDEFLMNRHVLEIIMDFYEEVDVNWARNNPEEEDHFFTGPNYPQQARDLLGYQ